MNIKPKAASTGIKQIEKEGLKKSNQHHTYWYQDSESQKPFSDVWL
jgi:hypothetical protein